MKKILTKIKTAFKNYKPNKALTFLFFIIPIFIFLIKSIKLDNDIYFILNSGKYILNHGIPYYDPFTIHSGLRLIMQQWLSSIIFYEIYNIFGYFGLIIFMFLINIIIIILLYKLCMLVSENKLYLSVGLTIIIDYLLLSAFIVTRPQLFDFILLILELYILEIYIRKKNTKILLILPMLSTLMINLHATSFFMMICFIIPYIIDSFKINLGFIKSTGYKKFPLIIITIIMLITGLINPYGIDAITYIFTSMGKSYISNFIIEMSPLYITKQICKMPILTIGIVIFIYTFAKKGTFKIRYLLLFLGTLYLSLTTIKATSFFYIAGIFPLADYLKIYFKEYKKQNIKSKNFTKTYTIILAMMILLVGALLTFHYQKKTYLEEVKGLKRCSEILNKIAKDQEITLYSDYYNGGYLEFMGLKPYIDPRADVFYKSNNKKKDIMKEYYDLQKKNLKIKKFLNEYNFTHFLVDDNDVLYNYLKNNKDYKIIYNTKTTSEKYYIFQKIKG